MNETKTIWKFWFRWNSQHLERWLETQAERGWKLIRVAWGLSRFTFIQSEPQQAAFCLDLLSDNPAKRYSSELDAQSNDYVELMKRDGWRLTNRPHGWYLWIKTYPGCKRQRQNHHAPVASRLRTYRPIKEMAS